jgi:hypothetical protein
MLLGLDRIAPQRRDKFANARARSVERSMLMPNA